MLSASDAKTKWDAICTSCASEIGGQSDFAGKMSACVLQLGIPAFKAQATTAERDALQAAFASAACKFASGPGSFESVPAQTVQMARQVADSQTPPIGAPAPPSVPSKASAASGGSPIVPIVAIAAGVGVLWWLLKSSKKRGT